MKRPTPVVVLAGLAVLLASIAMASMALPGNPAQKERHRRAITLAGAVHEAPRATLQFNNLNPNGPSCGLGMMSTICIRPAQQQCQSLVRKTASRLR